MKVSSLILLTLALTSHQPAFAKEQPSAVAGKDKALPTTTFGYEVAIETKDTAKSTDKAADKSSPSVATAASAPAEAAKKPSKPAKNNAKSKAPVEAATIIAPGLPGYEIPLVQPSEAKKPEAPVVGKEASSAPIQPELPAEEKTWLTNLTELIDLLIAVLSGNPGTIESFKTQLETIKAQAEVAKNQKSEAKVEVPAVAKPSNAPTVSASTPTTGDQSLVFQRAFECVSQAVLQAKVTTNEAGLKLHCDGATAEKLHGLLTDKPSEKADAAAVVLRGSKAMHCWKEQTSAGESPFACSLQLKMGRTFANASASANVPVRFADPTLDHTSLCIHEAAKTGSFTMENGVLVLTCRGEAAESFFNLLSTSRPVRVETFPTRGNFDSYYVGDRPSANATVCRYQTRSADGTHPRSNPISCQVTIDVNGAF